MNRVAHILIDSAVAYEYGPEIPAGAVSPMDTAMKAIADVGAATLELDDSGRPVKIDVSPIVNAAIVNMYVLAFRLSEATETPIEVVFADLREEIDAITPLA